MKHFLLVYRRSTGHLLRREEFGEDRETALRRRFELEGQEKHDQDVEVVLLSAETEESLRRTHARYFHTAAELAEALGDEVAKSGAAGDPG